MTLLGVPHVHPASRLHLRLEAGGSSTRQKRTPGHSQLPCLVLRGPREAESGSQAGGQGPPTAANIHHPELGCRQTPCCHPQLRRPRNLIGLLSVSHEFSIKTQCSSTDRLPLGVFPSLPLVKHHLERKERVRRASPTSQHRPARSRFPGKQVLEGEPYAKRGTEHFTTTIAQIPSPQSTSCRWSDSVPPSKTGLSHSASRPQGSSMLDCVSEWPSY